MLQKPRMPQVSDRNNYTISAILRIGDLTGENY